MSFKRKNHAESLAKFESLQQTKSFDNLDEWKLSTDKHRNGSAIIRFLPNKDENKLDFVRVYNHGFKVNGKWFIENCRTTLDDGECPVCKANGELWNTIPEAEQKDRESQHPTKKLVQSRKRKLSYWANIYVVKDEAKPDNVGKVFKYRFGSKILEKISAVSLSNPDLGIVGYDATCVFEGANFALKTKLASGFQNYDDSVFGKQEPLLGGDEAKLSALWDQMHDIDALILPDAFKSEEELTKQLLSVTGASAPTSNASDDLASQAAAYKPVDHVAKTNTDKLDNIDDVLNNAQPVSGGGSAPAPANASADDELDDLLKTLDL